MIPSHIKKHIILFALTILLSGIPAHSVNRKTKNGTKAKTEQKASTRKSASKKKYIYMASMMVHIYNMSPDYS